jgi:hypothetical protein
MHTMPFLFGPNHLDLVCLTFYFTITNRTKQHSLTFDGLICQKEKKVRYVPERDLQLTLANIHYYLNMVWLTINPEGTVTEKITDI